MCSFRPNVTSAKGLTSILPAYTRILRLICSVFISSTRLDRSSAHISSVTGLNTLTEADERFNRTEYIKKRMVGVQCTLGIGGPRAQEKKYRKGECDGKRASLNRFLHFGEVDLTPTSKWQSSHLTSHFECHSEDYAGLFALGALTILSHLLNNSQVFGVVCIVEE